MEYHYKYKCSSCRKEFDADEIESKMIYLCPNCGKVEKNKPLKGVLEIIYDYDEIKSNVSKKDFLEKTIGRFWEYPYLWPLSYSKKSIDCISDFQLNKISLINNPVINITLGNKGLKIFDDSRNPTLSFKDRASILVAIKALQMGIMEISAASTGNAGSSLAGICARLGIMSHIFVPKNIPESKRLQIQAFGANICIVDGDYDEAFDLCLEVSQKKMWYNRNTAYNPLTIEGKKSAIFDMFLSLIGELPENIFVPVGDGVIISGIYKGLKELLKLGWIDKLPKLIAVQAEGSNALARFIENDTFEYKPAKSIADSICAGAPRNLYMAAEAVKETGGEVIVVTDKEILEAQEIFSKKYGVLSEPAASASFAGYRKSPLQNSILMITGNGLKDISSLSEWNTTPPIKSYKDILKEFS